MPDHPSRIAARLLGAWNAHDVERIAALYAPDAEGADVASRLPQCGPEGARRSAARYLGAFPDLHIAVSQPLVQEAALIAVWTATGSHRGTFMGIPPTQRHFAVRGMSLLRIREGRICRDLHIWDVAGLLRALGLLPNL